LTASSNPSGRTRGEVRSAFLGLPFRRLLDEDELLDAAGQVIENRYGLTLTGPQKEREFPNSVLLSRSRFTARADRSLRFYREYFRPLTEFEIHKRRRRYHIVYKETEFAVNIDRIVQPEPGGELCGNQEPDVVQPRRRAQGDHDQGHDHRAQKLGNQYNQCLGVLTPPVREILDQELQEYLTDMNELFVKPGNGWKDLLPAWKLIRKYARPLTERVSLWINPARNNSFCETISAAAGGCFKVGIKVCAQRTGREFWNPEPVRHGDHHLDGVDRPESV
jgi:hypothetical protein